VAGTPTQRPRKPSKRGRARYGTHRTGLILAVLRRRGGLWGGDRLSVLAEAPQALKEGASTLRYAQNRVHISCSAAAWGVRGGDWLSLLGGERRGATYYRVAPRNLLIGRTILEFLNSCQF